jgi:hypothetical protein
MQPLPPTKKWRAITVATIVLVVAFWALLTGLVAGATDESAGESEPNAALGLAVGLSVIPFVFIALAFLSEHPRAPGAVLRAMGWSLLVGIPVSALAGDAVTGIVAGVGAGGIQALRMDDPENWKARAVGVAVAAAYTFVLARLAGALVLLPAPVFPLTALGVADHLAERRAEQDAAARQRGDGREPEAGAG